MTDYIVTDTELISVANAIRAKGGTAANLIWPSGYIAAVNAIPTGGVTIVDWATGTDAEIAAMIDAAHNGDIDLQQDGGWSVGDVRTISISAFTGGGSVAHAAQNVDIAISSFGDYMSSGSVLQFDFVDSLLEAQRMHSTNSNTMGYGGTEMKTVTLPALVEAMPTWIKDRLIEFSVLAGSGGYGSTIQTITGNKLALRSEVEITGTHNNSLDGEGAMIPYYLTSSNRIKSGGTGAAYNNSWFTRSPRVQNTAAFLMINDSGVSSYPTNKSTIGLSPFGCL